MTLISHLAHRISSPLIQAGDSLCPILPIGPIGFFRFLSFASSPPGFFRFADPSPPTSQATALAEPFTDQASYEVPPGCLFRCGAWYALPAIRRDCEVGGAHPGRTRRLAPVHPAIGPKPFIIAIAKCPPLRRVVRPGIAACTKYTYRSSARPDPRAIVVRGIFRTFCRMFPLPCCLRRLLCHPDSSYVPRTPHGLTRFSW